MALGYGPKPYVPPGPGKIPYRPWTANPLMDLSRVQPSMPSWTPAQLAYGQSGLPPMQMGTPQPVTGSMQQLLTAQPRALNPAPTPIAMGPAGSTTAPGFTPTAGRPGMPSYTMTEPLGLPAGSPLPAPPVSTSTLGRAGNVLSGAKSAVSGMTGSFLPGATGWKGMGANALTAVGIQALRNQQLLGGQATPYGRMLNSTLTGAGIGAIGGPKVAAALGATNLSMQAGAEKAKIVDQKGWGGLYDSMTPNTIGEVPGAAFDAATLPFTAPLQAVGALVGGSLGDVPLIGGLFGGGGDDEQAAQEQAAVDQAPRDYSSSSIIDTARAMGIPQSYIMPLTQQYESTVAYMKANPFVDTTVRDPDTGAVNQADTEAKQKMFADAGYKVGEDGMVRVDDAFITQSAWNQAYQALPQIQQEAVQSAEFARRNAALQAELAGMLPQATAGMDPEMRDAVMRSMSMTPQYTAAMEQADAVKSMTAQVLQQQRYAALQAAGLLPSSESSGGGGNVLSDETVAALFNQ